MNETEFEINEIPFGMKEYQYNGSKFLIDNDKKSVIKVGDDISIFNSTHFNWIQRKMWKFFFNADIENI